jgi:hypothetical protein
VPRTGAFEVSYQGDVSSPTHQRAKVKTPLLIVGILMNLFILIV